MARLSQIRFDRNLYCVEKDRTRPACAMTPRPRVIDDSDTADEAIEIMHHDLMYFDLDRKTEEIRHMRNYIQGAA